MSSNKLSYNIAKILGIIVLNNEGDRLYSKYYTNTASTQLLNVEEGNLTQIDTQKALEKNIFAKGKKLAVSKGGKSNEVFQGINDFSIYVIGDYNENELFLAQILSTLQESLSHICNKKSLMDNFDLFILIIDEMLDEGIPVTLDYLTLISRATMKDTEPLQPGQNESSGFGLSFFGKK